MTIIHRPIILAGFALLALSACGNSPSPMAGGPSQNSIGVDLGSSSRIPVSRMAMAGIGHGAHSGRMNSAPTGDVELVHDGHGDAHATGTVNSIDPARHTLNISHTPIPALGWPAMTMDFPVASSVDLSRVRPGSRVEFSIEKGRDGMYEVKSVQPVGAAR